MTVDEMSGFENIEQKACNFYRTLCFDDCFVHRLIYAGYCDCFFLCVRLLCFYFLKRR